jgi:cytoskeletal protein CcmA (bactofilin family)
MKMELREDESKKAIEAAPASPRPSSSSHAPQLPPRIVEGTPASQASTSTRDRTYLDQGSKVEGRLKFGGPVRIDGQIEGEIDAHDTSIAIGNSAVVTAKIKAVSVTVAGVVNGEIIASERIELQPSAKVTGSLAAPKLVMQEGAGFEGNCTMSLKAVRDERNPATSRKDLRETNGKEHAEHA